MSSGPQGPDDVHVTDSSDLLRDPRAVLAAGLAVLVTAVVTVVVGTTDPASAASYLTDVRNAVVVLADGTTGPARPGQRVPDGATVRTGPEGAATVVTAGRSVHLGALTTVQLRDGVRQELGRGQVMVDARGGARLRLVTRAGAADLPEGVLARVETGPVLRLGVFAGDDVTLTAAGRQVRTPVERLYQVLAPYAGLPGRPTVLALTGDAWEQRLAGELVNADRDLNALARGLSGADGATVLAAAPVALRGVALQSVDRGERALTVAVAQASRREAPLAETLDLVVRARGEGGSWGVVAALVEARVSAVSGVLDTLLASPGTPPPPVLAGPTPGLGDPLIPRPSTSGRPPTGSPSASPSRTAGPSPRPSATSSPTAPADDLVTTVVGLLSPSPSPSGLLRITLP